MDEQQQAIERQKEALAGQAQLASLYRVMCQTAGFQDLKKELENRIADLKNKWLTADDAEAQKIKIRGQVYNEVFDIIKSKILKGDMAGKSLDQIRETEADTFNPGNPG